MSVLALTVAFVFALVFALLFAAIALAVALAALYALAKFSISEGRFDVDACDRASRLNAIIDSRVQERLITANVPRPSGVRTDASGKVVSTSYGEQPVDPNVRTTSIVDDVHENEREANRVRSGDYDYNKRDDFLPPQPEIAEM